MAKLSSCITSQLDALFSQAFNPSATAKPYTPDLFADFTHHATDGNTNLSQNYFEAPKGP